MKKLLFVYNPHSGKGEIRQSLSDICTVFTEAGYDVTVHPTSGRFDGQKYISLHGGEYDLIVCSGGDGMLHELVCGISEGGHKKPCGYIPTGTMNDFATSLKIPKSPVEAAKMIVSENFEDIDIGSFNGSRFAYIAAFGMFTQVSYATDQKIKNALGATAYLIEVMKSMDLKHFHNASVHASIKWTDGSVEDDFIFGMTGNTFSVAGLKNLVPSDAEMNDGLLDGMFIKTPKSITELEQIMLALITQKYDIPNIVCAKSESFEIISESKIPWTLDGEYGGDYTKALISAESKLLKIAAPKN